jgi:membrane protein DedA with SNARE-associated domain
MSDSAADGSWLTTMVDALVGLIDVIGAPGAGIAIALENLFPPLPSEAILPLAGLAASKGSFTLIEAIAWTTAGSVVGALLLYTLGARFGVARLRWFAAKIPLLHPEDVDRTVAWFLRHGAKAVFFGRMIPIFRSLISIPAGVTRMPLLKFTLLTAAGSLIWNSIFVFAGYFLGEAWPLVEQYAGVLQYVVIAAVVVGVSWFVYVRVRSLLAARRKGPSDTRPTAD